MSAANDNSSAARDLALPMLGLRAFPVAGGAGIDLAKGGFDHVATVTLRPAKSPLGKSQGFTGSGNLRAAPPEINAIAGALAAMIAELPVRGGIVDRLA